VNLLSVDWDFFFADRDGYEKGFLYDWGHREAPLFINDLWEIRAAAFHNAGVKLPRTTGHETWFWEGIKCVPDAPLYVAESHAFAVDSRIYEPMVWDTDEPVIWSFDAHHDLGYYDDALDNVRNGIIECGSWLLWYAVYVQPTVHIRYPSWHRRHADLDRIALSQEALDNLLFTYDRKLTGRATFRNLPVFDAIFVCRSGAWVPSWLDDDFFTFLVAAPTDNIIKLGEGRMPLTKRAFDHALVDAYVGLGQTFAPLTSPDLT